MIFFKSCPRCAGDRSLENDSYGWYIICLGCGFVTYPEVVAAAKEAKQEAQRPAWGAEEAVGVETGQLPLAGFGG